MDHGEGKCNAPIRGAYVFSIVGYCALPENHTDRHQCAMEVQGGYRNVTKEPEDLLLSAASPSR
jgi:hypothetical protein